MPMMYHSGVFALLQIGMVGKLIRHRYNAAENCQSLSSVRTQWHHDSADEDKNVYMICKEN